MKTIRFSSRVIAGVLAAVLMLSLFGCGGKKETPSYEKKLDLTALYGEPVDYYGGWNTVTTKGDLQLEFNSSTMAVRISNTKTGSVWCSNPEDPDSDPVADEAAIQQMKSQVVVTYHDDSNNIGSKNSFADAAELDQVTTYAVEDGLAVHYVMGDASRDENDIPSRITDTRFNEAVLSKLSEEEALEMQDYYKLYEPEEEGEKPYWMFRKMYIEEIDRILELFDKAGYTQQDLIADNTENGVPTTIPSRWQFEVTLVYRLMEDGLVVDVPKENLRFPAEAPIYKLRVLENMVSADAESQGYLFVPDGSGALIEFDSTIVDRNILSLPVYGKNPAIHDDASNLVSEQAYMPVYGIRRGNSGLLAVIEDGATNATIEAYRAKRNNNYNVAYTDFDICSVDYVYIAGSDAKSTVPMYNTSALTGSCRLRFYMLEGEEADYVAMAKTYQKYLVANGTLPEKNAATVPLVVDTIGGVYGYKSFLGLSYVGLKAATTFEESQTILEALKAEGVEQVQLKLSGWFNDGYAHSFPKSVSVDGALGGKSGLKDLMAYCKERGIGLYPDVDMIQVYTTGNGFVASTDAAKYLDATEAKVYKLSAVDSSLKAPERTKPNFHYLLSPAKYEKTFAGMLKGFSKLGLSGISMRSAGSVLYGDYNDKKMYERNQTQQVLSEQLAAVADKNSVMFNGANDYVWKYASLINGAPVDYSYYELETAAVPFYQLVTSGYIPQTGSLLNTADDFQWAVLRCVEYGVGVQVQTTYQPSSFLKSTEYDQLYRSYYQDLMPEIVEAYGKVKEVLDAVAGSSMTDHRQITDDVFMSVYENGVTVYVNYGDTAYTADGQSVPEQGYAVVKK